MSGANAASVGPGQIYIQNNKLAILLPEDVPMTVRIASGPGGKCATQNLQTKNTNIWKVSLQAAPLTRRHM